MSQKSEEKRRRIIDSGLVLFARHGIRNTTLTAIAAGARLAKPTLYYYFPDGKETIFTQAIRRVVDQRWAEFEAAAEAEDEPCAKLRAYLEIRVRTFDEELSSRGVRPEVWDELKLLAWRVLEPYLVRERDLLERIVRHGVETGAFRPVDPEMMGRILQAAIKGVTADAPIDIPYEQRTAQLEQMFALFTRGLCAPSAGSAPPPA